MRTKNKSLVEMIHFDNNDKQQWCSVQPYTI